MLLCISYLLRSDESAFHLHILSLLSTYMNVFLGMDYPAVDVKHGILVLFYRFILSGLEFLFLCLILCFAPASFVNLLVNFSYLAYY